MKSSGALKIGVPDVHRHQPGVDLDRRRDHDQHRGRLRRRRGVVDAIPVANMWCAQTPKPMNATSSSAIATSGNATILSPRERRDDRRRDPERGQDDDVDLGVAEDPEEVLPEQRAAAVRWTSKKWKPSLRCSSRKIRSAVSAGSAKTSDERRREHREAEERHPVQRHARRAQLEDRDDEVDRRRSSTQMPLKISPSA